MPINLLRLNTWRKASIKAKRALAAISDACRAELLGIEKEEEAGNP